jgi:hypothetical protein
MVKFLKHKIRPLFKFIIVVLVLVVVWNLLSIRKIPEKVNYGVSFSVFHSNELKLDWKRTYLAILDDLKVRNFRFSVHWPLTEPADGQYNFSELDYQIAEADKRGATYILAVGRRLPGWPECHIPDWAQNMTEDQQRQQIFDLMETTVNRYKNSPGLKYWQMENEPYLGFFGRSGCFITDDNFLKKEIELVHRLDPKHKVLVTDSGEFGYWYKAYRDGDVFGSSVYLYVWWKKFGDYGRVRYPVGPSFFRVKQNIVSWIWGDKPKILIEMEAEPWLLKPIVDTPIDLQLKQMNLSRFQEILDTSRKAGFETQYLWGAEWWYWLAQNGHPEFWQEAKDLFK